MFKDRAAQNIKVRRVRESFVISGRKVLSLYNRGLSQTSMRRETRKAQDMPRARADRIAGCEKSRSVMAIDLGVEIKHLVLLVNLSYNPVLTTAWGLAFQKHNLLRFSSILRGCLPTQFGV
jgi:hypothetical protein